jgi:hypothetical protein
MATTDQINSLLREFSLAEAKSGAQAHALLEVGVMHAAEMLSSDEGAEATREHVRTIVQAQFRRVEELLRLALNDRGVPYENLRLCIASLELFNDPLFRIDSQRFDDRGLSEAFALVRKPFADWSPDDLASFGTLMARVRKSGEQA